MEIIKIVILSLSSLLLLFVGISRLSNPVKTYKKNSGINLSDDASLLSEIRGISAVMLCAGIIVGLGILLPNLTLSSFLVASLIYIGFLIGRLVSIVTDGKPNARISQGIWFEVVLGVANVFGFMVTV